MALFLDCFNPEKIKNAVALGLISGITSNPGLISREPESFVMKERIETICSLVNGPVAVEVTATDHVGMVAQARELYAWNPSQIVIKIPVSLQGYRAISQLEKDFSIPAMATCIMNFSQAYAAALAGAHYIALFWGRIEESGGLPQEIAVLLNDRIVEEKLSCRILAASIRGPHHVTEALSSGVHIVTLNPEILNQILVHQETNKAISEFEEDWRCARERGIMG